MQSQYECFNEVCHASQSVDINFVVSKETRMSHQTCVPSTNKVYNLMCMLAGNICIVLCMCLRFCD